MGTHGYGYNQICIRIHIIMGSQIPVDTRLATRPVPVTDFTHWYPCAWVFLPPLVTLLVQLARRAGACHGELLSATPMFLGVPGSCGSFWTTLNDSFDVFD